MTMGVLGQQTAGRGVLPLTQRESEIVALLARGKSNTTIAGDLGIALKTLQNHLNHILAKVAPPAWADPRVYLSLLYRWQQDVIESGLLRTES